MKNVTRVFVVVLALTGAAAATRISVISQKNPSHVAAVKATAFPIPTCPPGDPDACGMGGPNPNVVSR